MINQPEEVKKLSVTLSLMRQEMDVLKESKIKISSEIREKIREKQDVVLEIPELKKAVEIKKNELEAISRQLPEQEKLLKANEAVLQEKKTEHDLLSKEIGEMREELLTREKEIDDKEFELSARINRVLNDEKLLSAKVDKLNKAIKECL